MRQIPPMLSSCSAMLLIVSIFRSLRLAGLSRIEKRKLAGEPSSRQFEMHLASASSSKRL
jgi:hypothetical protein